MKGLYGPFHNLRAVCFFFANDFGGFDAMSQSDAWNCVVREYALDNQLVPLVRPEGLERHSFHRVDWKKELDYPAPSKYYGLFEDSVYDSLCREKPFEYENRSGIKIGGWPSPIQSRQRYPGEFFICKLTLPRTTCMATAARDTFRRRVARGTSYLSVVDKCQL
jgi:hypothetical protein